MRVRAHNHANLAAGGAPNFFQMFWVCWAWIDHDVATVWIAHPVRVGARAGHDAGVGGREAIHIFEQGHRVIRLPIEVVHDLAIGAGQGQFAIRRFVLHVALFFACQPACARATGPQRLVVDGTCV